MARQRRAVVSQAIKVEPDPANPRYIQTVWGFGYVYVPPGHPDAGGAAPQDAAP